MGNVLTDTYAGTGFPAWMGATWEKPAVLRYGENPHQRGRALRRRRRPSPGLATAEQLHGKEMSYNNYVDADAARRAAYDFDQPAVAIIKHANPCGIAVGADVAEAHRKAHACDPVSAFGGVIATNRPVSVEMARAGRRGVHRGDRGARRTRTARSRCCRRKKNIRILRLRGRRGAAASSSGRSAVACWSSSVDAFDAEGDDPATWTLATGEAADEADAGRPGLRVEGLPRGQVQRDPARQRRRLGRHRHGPGQPGRLLPPGRRAGPGSGPRGSFAASDAFFPFADGPQVLSTPGSGRSCSPAGRCATPRSSRPCRPPASPCTSRAPGTSSTDGGSTGVILTSR